MNQHGPRIIKVQQPLSTNDEERPWMIYDAKRLLTVVLPESAIPDHVKKALGTDPKGYFEGTWSSTVGWVIGRRVKEQAW